MSPRAPDPLNPVCSTGARATLIGPELEDQMIPMDEFLRHWEAACARRDLTKLVAEVYIHESLQSQAVQRGREFLLACALGPWEADDVLSEIALLTVADDGEETWHLRRLSGPQAGAITGGHLSAHFAKSFILATWLQPAPPVRSKRSRNSAPGTG